MDENISVIQLCNHLFRIGDEIGREIATVKLHTLDNVEFGFSRLGLLDSDHAFIANLLHGLGNHVADGLVTIGRNGADLCNFSRILDLLRAALDVLDGSRNGHVNTALQVHRVHAGGDVFYAFLDNGLRQNGCGCGAVASGVVGLGSHFAHHLGAHVFELVLKFDFLGNGHTVLGDARCAIGLVDDDIAALRAKGHLYGICKNIDAAQHAVACIRAKTYVFSGHVISPEPEGSSVEKRNRLNRRYP